MWNVRLHSRELLLVPQHMFFGWQKPEVSCACPPVLTDLPAVMERVAAREQGASGRGTERLGVALLQNHALSGQGLQLR